MEKNSDQIPLSADQAAKTGMRTVSLIIGLVLVGIMGIGFVAGFILGKFVL
jgi:hypothetical protein